MALWFTVWNLIVKNVQQPLIYCLCILFVCVRTAVVHDDVSGLEERPRAPGQHLTCCLWVWHPSSHQGVQVRQLFFFFFASCHMCVCVCYMQHTNVGWFINYLNCFLLALLSTTGGSWPIWQICWIIANSCSLIISSKDADCLFLNLFTF